MGAVPRAKAPTRRAFRDWSGRSCPPTPLWRAAVLCGANNDSRRSSPVPKHPDQIQPGQTNAAFCRVPRFAPDMQENGASPARNNGVAVDPQHRDDVVKRIATHHAFGREAGARPAKRHVVTAAPWIIPPPEVRGYRDAMQATSITSHEYRIHGPSTDRGQPVAFGFLMANSSTTDCAGEPPPHEPRAPRVDDKIKECGRSCLPWWQGRRHCRLSRHTDGAPFP